MMKKYFIKFIDILIFSIVLFSFLAGCSSLSGDGKLPSRESGFQINFLPSSSSVYINDELRGTTPMKIQVEPGQILDVKISKEGYVSYAETISIPPSGYLKLEGALAPLPQTLTIPEKGTKPGQYGEDICFISLTEPYSLICGEGDDYNLIYTFISYPEWIKYSSSGIVWSELEHEGIYVVKLLTVGKSDPQVIAEGKFVADWMNSEGKILLFGISNEQSDNLQRYIFKVYGADENINIGKTPEGTNPEEVSISADGIWLATKSSEVIEIWQKQQDIYEYRTTLYDVASFSFSPSRGAKFAYLDEEGNLNFIDFETEEEKELSPNVLAFQWIDDGERVLYSKKTDEGSSVFKMITLESNLEEIIADPSYILGNITDFTFLENENCILYGNKYGRMAILCLQ